MFRIFSLLLSVLLVGIFLFWGFKQIKSSHLPEKDIYTYVPQNAYVIIEVEKPSKQWKDILSNNIIWDELLTFDQIQNLEFQINTLDSAFAQNSKITSPDQLILSFVSDSLDQNAVVFQSKISSVVTTDILFESISKVLNGHKKVLVSENQMELETDYGILYILYSDQILTISRQKSILDEIQRQVANNQSLLSDSLFVSVKKTSSKNSNLRVLIQPNILFQQTTPWTNGRTQAHISTLPTISNWIELDSDIKPDEISLNGFATASGTQDIWLSLFKNQDPITPRVIEFLPDRTAFLMHYGFSDYQKLRIEYIQNKTLTSGYNYNDVIHTWDTTYDISIQTDFLNWIDNEIALIIAEPDRFDYSNDIMLWVSSNDSRATFDFLKHISTKIATKKDQEIQIINYRNYQIVQLDIPDFIQMTLGDPFKDLQENYFTQIDDYIVFANSPGTLQWTIDKIEKGLTLENDPHYENYTHRISNESNIYIYSNIAQSTNIYAHLLNSKLKSEIDTHREWIQKFQVFSTQISYESDDLYYVNGYFKYNPIYKKESNSLWETPLQFTSNFKPRFVKNHYTQATEIFTQDTNNIIYLIDNKGNILWSRQIDETIISTVKQIDALKNGKLQLAFNTSSQLYIIDRNGHDLKHFPIKLPAPASAPVTIADYDNNLNYRFLVPCSDQNIYNYDIKGNLITGWIYKKNGSTINHPLQHIKIKGKDYIIASYNDGHVKALDRRGNIRINLQSKFNFDLIGAPYVQVSSELENSYILGVTQRNEIVKIDLSDQKTRLFSVSQDSINSVSFKNVDDDGSIEIIFTSPDYISAFKTDGNQVFEFKTESTTSYKASVYYFGQQHYIGYSSFKDNRIYLSDFDGNIIRSFPLKGASPFSISDINNDGRFNVVTTDKDGFMYTYTLEI
ncbi:hypothetical protein KFE94_03450 [bacterium SCSIO 12643]|nr:hypothetical protein KFE94_03450 [bacterium SCSIO 12643]